MKYANEGKRKTAEKARALLAQSVRYCAQQGMSISATAEAVGVSRVHIRKIAVEHSIVFGKEPPCANS